MAEAINKTLKESLPFHFFLIATFGLIAYSNSFHSPFQWDGIDLIVKNSALRDLDNFISIKVLKSNRYIGYLTFALNYKMHGLRVEGFHIFNISIHILNAFLCYALVLLTFKTPLLNGYALNLQSRYIALLTGLLFVSHPIQTEAVTYIVQRFASLATFFYLASLLIYVRSRMSLRKIERIVLFLLSLLTAILAMKTKEIAITLPLVIALYEYMFFSGDLRRRFLWLIPLLITMIIIPLNVIGIEKSLNEIISGIDDATRVRDVSRLDYLLTESRVIITYLRLFVLPINQNLYYDYPIYHSVFNLSVFLSLLFLSGIFLLGAYVFFNSRCINHPSRIVVFGIFWFFLTLSVESSIIPLHVIYEHRLYLPSVGFFMGFAAGAILLVDKLSDTRIKSTAVISMAVVLFIFAYATYLRNSIWQSEISIWEDVVMKSPNSAKGHNNLGETYSVKGLTDKAIQHYKIAVRIRPDFLVAHNNLGIAYLTEGATDKAIEQFQIALRLNPDSVDVLNNLGNAYQSKGLKDISIGHYRTALRLNPYNTMTHFNLGVAYKSEGFTEKAIEHYRNALDINPDFANAHFNLGLIYLEEGHAVKAREEFEIALKINPDLHKAKRFLNHTSNSNNNDP